MRRLDLETITKQADEKIEEINETLVEKGLIEPDLLSTSDERSYVNTLPARLQRFYILDT